MEKEYCQAKKVAVAFVARACERGAAELLFGAVAASGPHASLHFLPLQAQNRFKVPLGTKFYRVKAVPWNRKV